jgi:YihY family inner membrane protein
MSTAATVPVTHALEGDDALETLRAVGVRSLLGDSLMRFRFADGFSHSRALAFQFALTLVPALIAIVGFAHELGQQNFTLILTQTIRDLAPGPAGEVLTQAIDQGSNGDSGGTALGFGLVAALVAGVTAVGQIERGSNRIYGVERDRPTPAKYIRATALALTAGVASILALVLMVAGGEIGTAAKEVTGWNETLDTAWAVGRWPLGGLLVAGAVALLFKACPRRDQPAFSWLVLGSSITVFLWFAFTGLLAAYIALSHDFGETYGPLAGVIGLLLWTFGNALALFLGLAVAAQLEAVRAGAANPGRAS